MQLFGDPNIKEFSKEHRFLSNFWPCDIVYEGRKFQSTEHAYVAAKNKSLAFKRKIQETKSAGLAKKMGYEITARSDWDEVKVDIMEELLYLKFSQEPLKQMLKDTGDCLIEEGNGWGDTFWGVDLETGKGKNILGKLLMEVRSKI